jgi:hypothetical protein
LPGLVTLGHAWHQADQRFEARAGPRRSDVFQKFADREKEDDHHGFLDRANGDGADGRDAHQGLDAEWGTGEGTDHGAPRYRDKACRTRNQIGPE